MINTGTWLKFALNARPRNNPAAWRVVFEVHSQTVDVSQMEARLAHGQAQWQGVDSGHV